MKPTLDAPRSPRWALAPVLSPGTPTAAVGEGRGKVARPRAVAREQQAFKSYTKTDSAVVFQNDLTSTIVLIIIARIRAVIVEERFALDFLIFLIFCVSPNFPDFFFPLWIFLIFFPKRGMQRAGSTDRRILLSSNFCTLVFRVVKRNLAGLFFTTVPTKKQPCCLFFFFFFLLFGSFYVF